MKLNLTRYASLATTTVALLMVACNSVPASNLSIGAIPSANQGALSDPSADAEVRCKKPDLLSDPDAQPLTLSDLQRSFWGEYELDEVHVYHRGDTLDGKYIGAFSASARRYIGNSTSNVRETELEIECSESVANSGVSFLSGVTIPVPSIVYPSSGRVTVFDKGSGNYDNPEFNFPAIADLHFDSFGMMSYKSVGSKVVGPPYVQNRYLSDVMKMLPTNAKIYRRNGVDGFEIRFTQQEIRDLGQEKKFQATTTVLITYKPSMD